MHVSEDITSLVEETNSDTWYLGVYVTLAGFKQSLYTQDSVLHSSITSLVFSPEFYSPVPNLKWKSW